jgi:hypothetical protein
LGTALGVYLIKVSSYQKGLKDGAGFAKQIGKKLKN